MTFAFISRHDLLLFQLLSRASCVKGQPFGQECKMPHAARSDCVCCCCCCCWLILCLENFPICARQFLILQRAFTLIRDIYSTHTQLLWFIFAGAEAAGRPHRSLVGSMTGATPARQTDRQADRADGQTEATSPTDTWKSWVNRFASATRCVSRVSTSTPFRTRLPGQALGQCQCPNHFVINYACAMLPPKSKKKQKK